jgi:2,4-diaminopentanoate dehydrogenase
VNVEGMPTVRTRVEVFPPADFVAKTFSDYMVLGMVMTAMPRGACNTSDL